MRVCIQYPAPPPFYFFSLLFGGAVLLLAFAFSCFDDSPGIPYSPLNAIAARRIVYAVLYDQYDIPSLMRFAPLHLDSIFYT